MKLTNYLRDSFVRSVKNNTPEIAVPTEQALQAAALKAMHPKARAMYKDEEARKSLKTANKYFNGFGHVTIVVGDSKLDDILKPFNDATNARAEVLTKVRSVAYGCTTLKQLKEALPQLVKHMPSEQGSVQTGLPVPAGIMDDLKAVGFKE